MIYRIEISEQADADLRGIFEYIAFDLESMQNANIRVMYGGRDIDTELQVHTKI